MGLHAGDFRGILASMGGQTMLFKIRAWFSGLDERQVRRKIVRLESEIIGFWEASSICDENGDSAECARYAREAQRLEVERDNLRRKLGELPPEVPSVRFAGNR